MSLVLDLAVIVIGLAVLTCLALLSWTLAVSMVRASGNAVADVRRLRREVAAMTERLGRMTPGDQPDR